MSRPIHIDSFETLLIANRGEIALRVMRTAKRLGLRTVSVYSDADVEAPHVRAADQAIRIGPPAAADSYLSISAIIEAARRSGAEAVHPGYGFLSESAEFARAVADAGLIFVGPPVEALEAMGRKDRAREIALAAGVPVLPSARISGDHVHAEDVGFPLLIKAAAGGGGKGMRVAHAADELSDAVAAARREAKSAFGDGTLIAERFVERGRHIEVQVLADAHGAVLHLGERDCSVQRRHQKVIEEAPALSLSPVARDIVRRAAMNLARAVDYTNAGTVEFLVDGDDAYFLEMNTRLQVEHPVTEMVTGVDLVAMQLLVADGQQLPLDQDDIAWSGHAIEARVYAEDPFAQFLPQAGTAAYVRWPSEARVEAALESGQVVDTHYDPMIAKIVVHASTRQAARLKLADALGDTAVIGITTNLGFLRTLVLSPAFRDLDIHTSWLDESPPSLPSDQRDLAAVIAAWRMAAQPASTSTNPFDLLDGWRLGGPPAPTRVPLLVGDTEQTYVVQPDGLVTGDDRQWRIRSISVGDPEVRVEVDGSAMEAFVMVRPHGIDVSLEGSTFQFRRPDRLGPDSRHRHAGGQVVAPMPGMLVEVRVRSGDRVSEGDILGVLEAMKMEMPLRAPIGGTVSFAPSAAGRQVDLGAGLFTIVTEGYHEPA